MQHYQKPSASYDSTPVPDSADLRFRMLSQRSFRTYVSGVLKEDRHGLVLGRPERQLVASAKTVDDSSGLLLPPDRRSTVEVTIPKGRNYTNSTTMWRSQHVTMLLHALRSCVELSRLETLNSVMYG